jgi:hypothetical protein
MILNRFARLCAVLSGLGLVLSGCTAGSAGPSPYADSNVKGFIGLCNKAGQPIDHGSVDESPFVGQAVASAPAHSPYDGYGKTATLYAYLPMEGQPAEDWAGEQMTASAYYSNPAHPMTRASADDGPQLRAFVHGFPPKWNGLVQLRMYLGAVRQPLYRSTYPATYIEIKGNTWKVVRGGTVPCDSGIALVQPFPPPPGWPAAPTGTVTPATPGAPGPTAGAH